jgi:Bacteriophage tail sheath protein
MARANGKVPGVYLQERRRPATPVLPTGVPVFVGLLTDTAPMPVGSASGADSYGPAVLFHKSEFLGGARTFLAHAIDGFFDNGGSYCYVVGIKADPKNGIATAARLSGALQLTAALIDVDLIAVPDAQALQAADGNVDEALVCQVQRDMIEHCTAIGTRVAVLDALRNKTADALVNEQISRLNLAAGGPVNAALYHPWVRTIASDPQFVPPCGQVAGIIARTDAAIGVFKAPANAIVQDATDVDADLDADSLARLNDAGVNCLRAFRARGIRIFGARTLSADPEWTYLNVRRLVLTLRRWIELNMTWVPFEPNVPALWSRIQRELTSYLTTLWRAGALQGDVATDAFFVRCDADLNPADVRELGQVVTEIGLAPAVPAEFIVVTVQHRAGTTELT